MEKINKLIILWHKLNLELLCQEQQTLTEKVWKGDISYNIWRWKKAMLGEKIESRVNKIRQLANC